MKDVYKPKDQLIRELEELRQRLTTLQATEAREAWHRAQSALGGESGAASEPARLEPARDLVLTFDAAGRITSANAAVEGALQYTRDQLMGMTLPQLVAPEHRLEVRRLLETSEADPAGTTYELDLLPKTGGRVPVDFSLRRIRVGGEPIELQAIGRVADARERPAPPVNLLDLTSARRNREAAAGDAGQQRLYELAPVGLLRLGLDGRILDANPAALELAGYALRDVEGLPFSSFLHAESADAAERFRRVVAGDVPRCRTELRCQRANGRGFWVSAALTLVREPGGSPEFCFVALEDVTERRQAEEALRRDVDRLTGWVTELEERTRETSLLSETGDLLQACRTADEAYAVIARMGAQLFPRESGYVGVISPTSNLTEAVAVWGTPPGDRLFRPEDCWALRRGRPHLVQDPNGGPVCGHRRAEEATASLCVPMMAYGEAVGLLHLSATGPGARLPDPKYRLALTVAEHIALALANLKLQETLRSQSIRDPLTGLFNRRYMEESLEREMRRANRARHPVGIIMLDLDHFKEFNDTYGHDAGDLLLREVGAVLQRSIRGEDIACRFGGEEFILILPEASLADAAQRAEQIRDAVKAITVVHRRQSLRPVTVSLGVAIYPDHGHAGDVVVRAADVALYQAKAQGRDRVSVSGSPA